MCCFSFLTKVLALSLALIFMLLIASAVWGVNIANTAFKAETYTDTFSEQNVYENIVPLILPALADTFQIAEEDNPLPGTIQFRDVVDNLNQDDWNAIAGEIVPPDYLQQEAEENLEIYFDYTNGNRARLDIVFDTSVIRENLLAQPGDRMINRIFSSWATCDAAGEAQMNDFLTSGTGEFPYCKPSDTRLQRQAFTVLNNAKNDLARQIPDYWSLREVRAKNEAISLREVDRLFYEEQQRPGVMMQGLYPLSFLCPAAFLAMIVIVAVRSGKGFFAWMGWSVALGGIMALLPLGILPLMLGDLYAVSFGGTEVDVIQAEALRGMARSLVGEFTQPILLQGALLVGIGFLCVFVSIWLRDPDEDAPAPVVYPQYNMGYGSSPMLPQQPITPTPTATRPITPSMVTPRLPSQPGEPEQPPS